MRGGRVGRQRGGGGGLARAVGRGRREGFPPPLRRRRSDWHRRAARADWPMRGEAGERSRALIGCLEADRGEDGEPNRFPAQRGGGGGEACARVWAPAGPCCGELGSASRYHLLPIPVHLVDFFAPHTLGGECEEGPGRAVRRAELFCGAHLRAAWLCAES